MNLFIDTNIYLNFYDFSSDDLDELHKLAALIEHGEVTLLLPEQTLDEFWRNHESKLDTVISRFRSSKLDDRFPQICKSYGEYQAMRDAIRSYKLAKSTLLANLQADIDSGSLKADEVIKELFEAAKPIERSGEVVDRARLRYDLGNPPGKDGSYGDAVSWESLLSEVGDEEDLCVVSDDKDFKSKSDSSKMSPFLIREWNDSDRGELLFYERLSLFLKDKFPTIHVAHEAEKELLIKSLSESRSFAKTHEIVDKLSKYTGFSSAQANDILSATISNPQVMWIVSDEDVAELLKGLIQMHRPQLDAESLGEVLKELEME